MALYTDGPPSTIEDLTAEDSQLLDVCSTEGIDLTKKVALADERIGIELEGLLRRQGSSSGWTPEIASISVTAPLRLWHTYQTLALVYSDAYHNQSNDRYARKRDEFGRQAKWAYEELRDAGLGIVSDPLPLAATPSVTTSSGSLPDGTYYVTVSWVNAAGEEGAPAATTSITLSNQTLLVQPGQAPANACGWHVYIGAAPDAMVRQNATPLAIGGGWMQPGPLVAAGPGPSQGQTARYFLPIPRVIQRG